MFLIDTYLDKSKIHGVGVFSKENIKKGEKIKEERPEFEIEFDFFFDVDEDPEVKFTATAPEDDDEDDDDDEDKFGRLLDFSSTAIATSSDITFADSL